MAKKNADEDEYCDDEDEDEYECLPKVVQACTPKPRELYPDEHICPGDIDPCTLLEDPSKIAGASKTQNCMDKDELDPKIRLKREHELACRTCPSRTCHETDMLHPGGKCEEDDPKKKKKKY